MASVWYVIHMYVPARWFEYAMNATMGHTKAAVSSAGDLGFQTPITAKNAQSWRKM